MPWLPLYLHGGDLDMILAMLNGDPETAFIVADGPAGGRQWQRSRR
jgi:hypothetical protein